MYEIDRLYYNHYVKNISKLFNMDEIYSPEIFITLIIQV